jgi:iron complex outermembrane receptor protein/vitamin B12 transporter
MPDSAQSSSRRFFALTQRALPRALPLLLLAACAALCPAASIRGVVTDTSGAKVTGATVVLISGGKAVATAVSTADGSFQMITGIEGRFFLIVSAKSFRQLETPGFYAGRLDSVERNIVLEPEWVRESIVVTATGTPTPQPQTGAATSVLGPPDLALRDDLTSALRLMPGTVVVRDGQLGAQTSLFIRGGDSDSNKMLLDGVSIGDLGGQFDFGPLTTTALEHAEVYRGPDSSLYGADAASGVVSLATPHGTTPSPSILLQADAGNLDTSREELEIAGAHNKLDYLGAFSWLQTANDLPLDEYHVATSAANIGWQPSGSTQIRATLHYGVDATGVPNAWDFYHISDDRKEGDQDLYGGATLENQTTPDFHNRFQYGLTRKREQSRQWYPAGVCIPADSCVVLPANGIAGNYYGLPVLIQGANGYSAMGPALLDYSTLNYSVYPNRLDIINNRDQFLYQGDIHLTPHFMILASFQYENERAAEREKAYLIDLQRTRNNYDYIFGAHGDFLKERIFYTLGMDVMHYQLIGNGIRPHAGLSGYALRPRHGIFSGTRLDFSFSQGIREPKLTDEFGSLYEFLEQNNGQATIQQMHISPIEGPTTRTWEGGGEQAFWSQRIVFRASYFHNEFGRAIEGVGAGLVPSLLPNLTPAQQKQLESILNSEYAYSLDLNSLAFRAQGVETTVESGIGRNIFFRGGYTYLDSVVQHSFSSDNETAIGIGPTLFEGTIPVGIYSPLKGARPFRRPPHTGFITASYSGRSITGIFTSAFSSRGDDSTFLGYEDLNQGNSLVLPNRNLDWGYAKLDLGASFKLLSWLNVYAQAENLMDNRHIAPVGYPSLPFNVRTGLRIEWTKAGGK